MNYNFKYFGKMIVKILSSENAFICDVRVIAGNPGCVNGKYIVHQWGIQLVT